MRTANGLVIAALGFLALAPATLGQPRPYIGYAYPAGGRQGTVFQVKLGGQGLDDVNAVFVTGSGVSGRVVEYQRALNPQEITLLNEQLRELKRARKPAGGARGAAAQPGAEPTMMMMSEDAMRSSAAGRSGGNGAADSDQAAEQLIAKIERRLAGYVNRPASAALAHIVWVEITIAPDAAAGPRELRLGTPRGVSNPLVFHVGQLPELCRKPMVTAPLQVLGKEELALRKRPPEEEEERITLPCTLNGQIASGERNRYRFTARKGQRLVMTCQARQLIPYIADAVPGWFQPVLALYDARGREVAYDDDYQFRPDPTLFFEVPQDGEYVLAIYDAIYRGREDFVYRITAGEIPFVTSHFPLGACTNAPAKVSLQGWNLGAAESDAPGLEGGAGRYSFCASSGSLISNPRWFDRDILPETFDREPNNATGQAQRVSLPVIINGRIGRSGDWDVFQFSGKSNDTVVAEVLARRLESPLDSVVKVTDAAGNLVAFNDDCEDLEAGVITHHADSCLTLRLPADGTYYVHLGDTARNGGEEFGYRLRLSPPRPDFALRVVPSSVSLRSKGNVTVNVHVIRKDGFTGPIQLALKDPPDGFSASPVSLTGTQTVARLNLRTTLPETEKPVNLTVTGTARIQGREVTREAVPAEDRMQAFLWRHLVPAADFKVLVYNPNYQPPPKRVPPPPPAPAEPKPVLVAANASAEKPKFSKQQVAGRLRQLKLLYEEGLLTDEFHAEKVAECEAAR